ncbi:MAG: alpha/beta hydrolase [Chitinophagaceae bacterium]|nr:alpha/beta hydrolase [Chitinophagaceae bacterium]
MNKEIQITGKKIYYRIIGEGNPVMLVHGFGEDGTVWKNQVDFLKDKFRIIIPDLPGSGKSELIENSSLEDMAEVLHQIIHEEDIDHCVMIGHSMGGYITLAFAEMYWNHLTAFGLFHSSAYADSKEKITTRQKGIEFINEHGAFAFLKTATPNLFSPLTKAENPGLIDKQINSLDNFSPAALVSYYEAMISRPDRTAILLQTTVPVLFIIGKYDNAVPPEDSLQQCHLPEKSYIHMLNRSGHMGMLEEPQQSNQILEKFLLDI